MTIGVKIKQIKKMQKPHQKWRFEDVKVYDIEVEDAHHYIFEDGTISHNSYVPTQEMGGGCLSAGTKIFTRGGYKNIEDITEDDYVYTKEGEFKKVLETHNFKEKDLLQIEFDDGYKVTCTPEHKFLINGEWIEAKNLVVDGEVSCIN